MACSASRVGAASGTVSGFPLVLALDLGSSSVRCSAYRGADVVAGSQQQSWRRLDADGAVDVTALCEAAEEVMSLCLDACGASARVQCVAISCFAMNLVGVDGEGRAVTPLLSYAAQRREVAALSASLGALPQRRALERLTGTIWSHPSYAAAQLLALPPDAAARAEAFTTLASLLLARWTAGGADVRGRIGISEAAWTGMLSLRSLEWEPQVLALLPPLLRSKLPAVGLDGLCERPVAGRALARWPQLADARLALGVADGACANVGSMCADDAGRIAVTVGTSAAVRVLLRRDQLRDQLAADATCVEADFPPPGLWCYSLDRERVLLGGALTDGGSVYEWARAVLRWDDQVETQAAALEPGAHGLTVLPFLRGERAMGWHASATMTLTGITGATTAAHLLRAALEGVALRLAKLVASVEAARPQPDAPVTLVASGTALASSRLLQQVLADAVGKPLFTSEWAAAEATSRGAAMLAAAALDADLRRRAECGQGCGGCERCSTASALNVLLLHSLELVAEPDPRRTEAYRNVELPKQDELYATLYASH
jgi:gluconokinase